MLSFQCIAISLIFVQTALCLDAGLSAYEVALYSVPFDCDLCQPKFNHFAIHNMTGDVYLGASNKLVHLNSAFQEIKNISTFVSCAEGIDREDCINHNKILAIYYDRDILITCGNMNDGKCQIRKVSDISNFTYVSQSVAAPWEFSTEYVIAPAARRTGRVKTVIEDSLYIAASGIKDQYAPVYARRNLENDILPLQANTENTLRITPAAGYDFVINYIDVFTHNRYTYFATNQPFDFQYTNVISKLNRACHESDDLDSYAEVVIECRGSNEDVYNLIRAVHLDTVGPDLADSIDVDRNEIVLIGLFAKSVGPEEYTPDSTSAICIFDMDDIETRFIDAIEACFEGGQANGVNYLTGKDCSVALSGDVLINIVEAEKCTAENYAHPRGKRDEPITSTAIMELPSTLVSSIITTTEEQHTIAFIGTATGEMLKVHLTGDGTNRVYETLNLGSPVLNDVELTKTEEGEDLTVLTEQKIYRLMVENCGFYTTCEDCIGVTAEDGDPYCGWCSLTRVCTRKSECAMPDTSTRWLSYNEAQCLEISSVSPYDSQPYSVKLEITVTTEQLPDLPTGESYNCIFNLNIVSLNSPASKSGNDLACMTPSTEQLPPISKGEDHIAMMLSIQSSETGVKFVDTNFTFYRCGTHKRCLDCASSKWDCDWCTYGDICTHDSAKYCTDDIERTLIAGIEHRSRDNPTRRGPTSCAQLVLQPGEVFLASGVNRTIDITVRNLPDRFTDLAEDAYTCILHIDGKTQEAQGTRMGDGAIQCSTTQYTYEEEIQELNANLTLQWIWGGKNRTIDDEFGFRATLFKCEVLRPDCSRCVSALTTRPELRCGWCSGTNMCAVNDHPQCGDIDSWIRETADNEVIAKSCPVPKFNIWPSSGPIEGNTLIEITGTELGRRFDTIKSITVAGEECNFADYEQDYVIGERLLCRTLPGSADATGDVLVTVAGIGDNDLTNEINNDNTTFTYRNPTIYQISPKYGPQAGGTKVNITGDYLSAGRTITVQIGNSTCVIDRLSKSEGGFICTTEDSFVGDQAQIVMSFDGAVRRSTDMYEYRENPTVSSVSPFDAFKAGGRLLTVRGTNLDVVQAPEVIIVLNSKSFRALCTVIDGKATAMLCPSPEVNLPFPGRRKRQILDDKLLPPTIPLDQEATGASLGFVMDGVRELLTWSVSNNRSFLYFQDPDYTAFEKNITDGDTTIEIEGERLNLASSKREVTVLINSTACTVTSLGLDSLFCLLPGDILNKTSETSETLTYIVDIFQGNLVFDDIGIINYLPEPKPQQPEPLFWLLGIAIGILTLLVLVLVASLYYYRKQQNRWIDEANVLLLESLRRLHSEADRGLAEAKAALKEPIKITDNVTVYYNDVQIRFDQLEFKNELGKGEIGRVFLATLQHTDSAKNVAVKTVKDNMDASFTIKFLEEAMIMKNFKHPNVLGLLGLTFDHNKSPLVILPFMKNGDLRSFVRKQGSLVTVGQMISFALDGAKGMTYLSDLNFVHRDLAARNCMIDEDLTLKIADFGLSRDMNESDYYRSDDRAAKLPMKWMAPESLAKRVYSAKSDVWSFAVMLWEMCSKGTKPYKEVANRDIYFHITGGNRLHCPSICPPEMYDIMTNCWKLKPNERPTFRNITNAIQTIKDTWGEDTTSKNRNVSNPNENAGVDVENQTQVDYEVEFDGVGVDVEKKAQKQVRSSNPTYEIELDTFKSPQEDYANWTVASRHDARRK